MKKDKEIKSETNIFKLFDFEIIEVPYEVMKKYLQEERIKREAKQNEI